MLYTRHRTGILALGMEPKFFATPAAWREWLEKYHDRQGELLVGFYNKNSGKASITWPESVDAALCFGWIDGVHRRIDDASYSVRFTLRKPRSTWSAVNIKRVQELTRQGLMHTAGIKAYEARHEERSGIYSFEQRNVAFAGAQEKRFRANESAWTFFLSQPPGYRRTATYWVISTKREETRAKRLATFIEYSERRERLTPI
jgi:uncharacterized protein YdeI (YjbR/CyaY-like superfamily)